MSFGISVYNKVITSSWMNKFIHGSLTYLANNCILLHNSSVSDSSSQLISSYSFIHLFIYLFIHLFIFFFCWFIYPFICNFMVSKIFSYQHKKKLFSLFYFAFMQLFLKVFTFCINSWESCRQREKFLKIQSLFLRRLLRNFLNGNSYYAATVGQNTGLSSLQGFR